MFDPDGRNWIIRILRDGKEFVSDSERDFASAILFPNNIRDVMPDDEIVIEEITASGTIEHHRHLFRDHGPIEKKFFE